MKHGPWIAGGAVRKVVMNEPIDGSDIDIFFSNKETLQWAMELFKKIPNMTFDNVNNFIYHKDGIYYKFQLVSHFFYPTVEELLKGFDFTTTMFATDGKVIFHTKEALLDSCNKELVFNKEHEKGRPLRLQKYAKKGFTPSPGMIPKLMGLHCPNYIEGNIIYYAKPTKDSDEKQSMLLCEYDYISVYSTMHIES